MKSMVSEFEDTNLKLDQTFTEIMDKNKDLK